MTRLALLLALVACADAKPCDEAHMVLGWTRVCRTQRVACSAIVGGGQYRSAVGTTCDRTTCVYEKNGETETCP